jgi:hypothetical protein
MKINNWTQCIQDRVKWEEVDEAKNLNNEIVAPDVEEGIKSLPPSQIFSGSSTAYKLVNFNICIYIIILCFYAQ